MLFEHRRLLLDQNLRPGHVSPQRQGCPDRGHLAGAGADGGAARGARRARRRCRRPRSMLAQLRLPSRLRAPALLLDHCLELRGCRRGARRPARRSWASRRRARRRPARSSRAPSSAQRRGAARRARLARNCSSGAARAPAPGRSREHPLLTRVGSAVPACSAPPSRAASAAASSASPKRARRSDHERPTCAPVLGARRPGVDGRRQLVDCPRRRAHPARPSRPVPPTAKRKHLGAARRQLGPGTPPGVLFARDDVDRLAHGLRRAPGPPTAAGR